MAKKTASATRQDAVASIVEDWRRERPDLDTAPLEVFGRLHRAFLRYSAAISRPVERKGLSMAGFDVLTALRRAGAPFRRTAGELADSGLISSAGVTLRIDRLEKDGLILRERDPQDRRVVHSRLTDEGLSTIDELFSEHLENERRMLAGLTPAECRQLARLLEKLERSVLAAEDGAGEAG
ncbi:MarR family transcriptional regulator [Streptomyces sp. NBC_01724]|uniref:MarR family winged helix-turn-helix transcriptional regulator n=1 Tax=unclassified Streptomyces TaxID=2593676 RepID=UPI0028C3BB6F|nr:MULTISPECIES: MarR family transcriptional regulator [unclassified Streptomyces]WNO64279.1 MarR family transcriptional regulator [Streptomyces sp. AM2-3-1]WSC68849.1 MarR family transcriptional regulator [Streptomyces sp. NBC_01760]WTE59241.1 MarR family transcriptional regulator [Streptomyces sp. NBC_01617]WTI86750.1 MarR family transcriptional regulator [Streptomyces sp. NBC_00724]